MPSSPTLGAIEGSDPTYSSLDSLNTDEDDTALDENLEGAASNVDENELNTDDDERNRILQVNLDADHYRLCKAKTAHDTMLGKIDASLAKKTLTATEAAHLDTKAITTKMNDVAKTIDLSVSTILAEQTRDPVLGTVRSWIRKRFSPDLKLPET